MNQSKPTIMTFQEIKERMDSEGVTALEFVLEEVRPEWMGKVECVNYKHMKETEDELEAIIAVYHLLDHGIFLRAMSTKEGGEWNFWEGFEQCKSAAFYELD